MQILMKKEEVITVVREEFQTIQAELFIDEFGSIALREVGNLR